MKLQTILTKLNNTNLKNRVEELKKLDNFSSNKNFYGKAHTGWIVVGKKYYKVLKSYNTYVAIITFDDDGEGKYYFENYSTTTLRHIKEFLGTTKPLKILLKERTK